MDSWPDKLIGIQNNSRGLEFNSSCLSQLIDLFAKLGDEVQIAVVGIIGQPHSGKSVIANYIIEYLENFDKRPYNWLQTCGTNLDQQTSLPEDREHFERLPRSGLDRTSQRNTEAEGVYVWPIQNCMEQEGGRKLCILVMDIVFNSTINSRDYVDYTRLIDFIIQSSSVLVFCDSWKNWTNSHNGNSSLWWTPKSSIVYRSQAKSASNCYYLLRDWDKQKEFRFGSAGGRTFLERISNSLGQTDCQFNSDFEIQMKEISSYFSPSFKEFQFHLLPPCTIEHGRITSESTAFLNHFKKFIDKEINRDELRPIIQDRAPLKLNQLDKFFKDIIQLVETNPLCSRPFVPNFTVENYIKISLQDQDVVMEDVSDAPAPKMEGKVDRFDMQGIEQALDEIVKNQKIESQNSTATPATIQNVNIPDKNDSPFEAKAANLEENEEPRKDVECSNALKIPDCLEKSKPTKEESARAMFENEVKKFSQELTSSPFKFFENIQEKLNQIRENVSKEFPLFFAQDNNDPNCIQDTDKWIKNHLEEVITLNRTNRQRVEAIIQEINEVSLSLLLHLISVLKEKIEYPATDQKFEKLTNLNPQQVNDQHISNIKTKKHGKKYSKISKFQKISKSNSESICVALNGCVSNINSYTHDMQTKFSQNVCFETPKEFENVHQSIVSNLPPVQNQWVKGHEVTENKWRKQALDVLQSFVQFGLKARKETFGILNSQIRLHEEKISNQAVELAMAKYNDFMMAFVGKNIFRTQEIRDFHKKAFDKLEIAFNKFHKFTYTHSWKISWMRLESKLEERFRFFCDDNCRKIRKSQLARKNAENGAENRYREIMFECVKGQGQGKSVPRAELQQTHRRATEEAIKFLNTKMKFDGVENLDPGKSILNLKAKMEELRKQLTSENEEKVKKEADAAAKQRRIEAAKRTSVAQSGNHDQGQLQHQGQGPSTRFSDGAIKLKFGVGVYFGRHKVQVGVHTRDGFDLIDPTLIPTITFTPSDICIGQEGDTPNEFKTNKPTYCHLRLFDILETDQFAAPFINIGDKSRDFRIEEILAIFLHKIKRLVETTLRVKYPSFVLDTESCCCVVALGAFEVLPLKKMLKTALILAGFENSVLIHSTTAAAISYWYDKDFSSYSAAVSGTGNETSVAFIQSTSSSFEIAVGTLSPRMVAMKGLRGPSDEIKTSQWKRVIKSVKNFGTYIVSYFSGTDQTEMSETEKAFMGLIKDVVKETKMTQIERIVSLEEKKDQSDYDSFLNVDRVETMDEMQGIVSGAAILAATKSNVVGLKVVSINYSQVHPYDLKGLCLRDNGGRVTEPPLWSKNERQGISKMTFDIPPNVSKIVLNESTVSKKWTYGTFQVNISHRLGDCVQLEISYSQDGLPTIKVKGSSGTADKLIPQNNWMNGKERGLAAQKLASIFQLKEIFPEVVIERLPTESQLTSPSLVKDMDTANKTGRHCDDTEFATGKPEIVPVVNQNSDYLTLSQKRSSLNEVDGQSKTNGTGSGLGEESLSHLEKIVNEVEGRVEASQNTNPIIKDRIVQFIKEIRNALNHSSEINPVTVRDYEQRLTVMAARIKD